MKKTGTLILSVVLLGFGQRTEAQVETQAVEQATVQAAPKAAEASAPVRDPFAASGTLKAYASPQALVQGTDQRFLATGSQAGAVPKMRMLGYLKGKGGESVALLEVDEGRVHIVREGDAVGLRDIGGAVLRIKTINRLHLVVETGTLGQVIIVR